MSSPPVVRVSVLSTPPSLKIKLIPKPVVQVRALLQIPAQLSVVSTTTGDPGTDASVVNVGTPGNARLQFTIPRGAPGIEGDPGPANSLTIGAVDEGATADATITGDAPNQVLNLTLPKGDVGDAATIEIGTVTTVSSGSPATVENVGTDTAAIFNFGIPKGADGIVQSLVAGDNVTIDLTDPANPIINSTASGSGDVVGPASATDGHIPLFDGTTGKLLKDGKAAPSGDIVGTSDTQTLTNKTATSLAGSAASSFTATTQSALDNSTKLATTAYVYAATREKLSADRTYYVDVTNGSDANDGLASGSGHAWQTLQHAVDVIAGLDIGIHSVTVNVADGTYTSGASTFGPWLGTGNVTFVGNTTTPANVIVNPSSGACFQASGGGFLRVSGMTLKGQFGLLSQRGSRIYGLTNLVFGAASAYQSYANAGQIILFNNYEINGSAGVHLLCDGGGQISATNLAITLTGTPAFSSGYVNAGGVGSSILGYSCTWTGSATGPRYVVQQGALINSNGGGASYFPGNSAGTGTNFSASPWGLYQ